MDQQTSNLGNLEVWDEVFKTGKLKKTNFSLHSGIFSTPSHAMRHINKDMVIYNNIMIINFISSQMG